MAGVRRGDPLLFLMAVLAGWATARTITFSPLWQEVSEDPSQAASPHFPAPPGPMVGVVTADPLPAMTVDRMTFKKTADLARLTADNRLLTVAVAPVAVMSSEFGNALPLPSAHGVPVASQSLGFGNRDGTAALPAQKTAGAATGSRWSADSWLLLRRDSITPLLSSRPSYGRSQVGAVIRYSLAAASALRPQAYLRASAALAGAREHELAAGVSVRPLAGLPLRFALETRIGETGRGTRLRPAAFAVTEFARLRLPLGMRGEAYAQGGYVGGGYPTAFVDGQVRVERPLVRSGEIEVSAGAGAWGGAQRGAARLDIGPTAAVSFRLGGARGRVAADYRFRVAGDAEPSSGPALTLSAGF